MTSSGQNKEFKGGVRTTSMSSIAACRATAFKASSAFWFGSTVSLLLS